MGSDGDATAHHKMTQTKATKAMYTCMARSLKMGTNCPLYTKALLYKAYVIPIATYGIETNIFSESDRATIDRTNLQYCRWAMGVNKRSNVSLTLRECKINPIQTDIDRAQAAYLLTALLPRDDTHLTTAALKHIWATPTSRLHKDWLQPTLRNIERWKHDKLTNKEILNPNESAFRHTFNDRKAIRGLNTWVKKQCKIDLNHEILGNTKKRTTPQAQPPRVPPAICKNAIRTYAGHEDNTPLLGHKHNIQTNRTSQLQTAIVEQTYRRPKGPLAKTHTPDIPHTLAPLSRSNLQLLERFRLRTTRHNAYKFLRKDQTIAELACPFCTAHGNLIIEDIYHVCLECPLYSLQRRKTLDELLHNIATRSTEEYAELTNNDSPYRLLGRILTPQDNNETKTILHFLRECQNLRAHALESDPPRQQPTAVRERAFTNFMEALNAAQPLRYWERRTIHPKLTTALPPLNQLRTLIQTELNSGARTEEQTTDTARPRRRPGRIIAYL